MPTTLDQADFRNLAKSVKKNEAALMSQNGFAYFLVPYSNPYYVSIPYDLPYDDWLSRDKWLRFSTSMETMWASAIAIAVSKLQSLAVNISGDVPLRVKRAQELLLNADGGRGWVPFVGKVGRDYLTTNNGGFYEIERYTGAMGSRIKALHHLDSLRCRRTGDNEIPVIYMGLDGREYELRYYQVIDLCDQPDCRAESRGQGECAAQRAWPAIAKLAAIERFVFEKVAGRRPLAIHLVSGVTTRHLEDVVAGAQQSASSRGVVNYMGAALAGFMSDKQPGLVTIPLAELPNGFDPEKERNDAYLRYADAIGLDIQDIQPLSKQGFGTGAQSETLADKEGGKGLASFKQDFTHKFNRLVLDEQTIFAFNEKDLRDEKAKAEISKIRAETRKIQAVDIGEITPEQSLQMAVDADDAPKEFLPEDETSFEDLSDTEKPVDSDEEGEDFEEQPLGDEIIDDEMEATKEAANTKRLVKQEMGKAKKLFEEVRG